MSVKFNNLNESQKQVIESWAKGTVSRCLTCQTALIDDLMGHGEGRGDIAKAFQWDNVTNLYPVIPDSDTIRDEWDIDQCHDFLAKYGRLHDAPKHAENQTDYSWEEDFVEYTAIVAEEIAEDNEAQEICEWWLVSDNWVAGKLIEIGEPVLDNDYGYWWGRTSSGQNIILDETFQNMYLHVWGAPSEDCTK